MREEHEKVTETFQQTLNNPKNSNTKLLYEKQREQVAQQRLYIDSKNQQMIKKNNDSN